MASAEPSAATGPAFPISWGPGEDQIEWEWDDMHTPRALPPLSVDYLLQFENAFGYMYRSVDSPKQLLVRVWNGYAYFGLRVAGSDAERQALRERELAGYRAHIPLAAAYWRAARRELETMYADIDAITGAEPADVLAAGWERAWEHTIRAWELHFHAIKGPYQVLDDLADLYKSLVPGASPAHALELVAGTEPEMRQVEIDLEALTAAAASAPAVATRLQASPPPSADELRALSGAGPFLAQLDRFLSAHGHLGQVTDDLLEPSWLEDPRPLLGDVGIRIGRRTTSAAERAIDRAAVADRRADEVRARLADRPADLSAFEALLARAREIGHLTEGHNYWIDRMVNDRLRRLSRRVGRRLVAGGVIDDAEDVVFLRRDEVAAVIREPRDRRAVVAERRAIHERNQAIVPPKNVGRMPDKDPTGKVDRFEGARPEVRIGELVRGTGASAGIARGVARVLTGPADFHRVEPGDIVVATTSNPGWVPLFAIAGGFITDTGGVLSHAAVVAREFGVPAVVGTGDGTGRIVDGTRIELDGTSGVVRIP